MSNWQSDEIVKAGHDPNLKTNKCLFELLRKYLLIEFADTYAMDVFPFIKKGNMSVKIPLNDLVETARTYAIPAVKIIDPKLTVCLGLATFNALRKASNLSTFSNIEEGTKNSFSIGHCKVFGVAHTGRMGTNMRNRKNKNQVDTDWSVIQSYLNAN